MYTYVYLYSYRYVYNTCRERFRYVRRCHLSVCKHLPLPILSRDLSPLTRGPGCFFNQARMEARTRTVRTAVLSEAQFVWGMVPQILFLSLQPSCLGRLVAALHVPCLQGSRFNMSYSLLNGVGDYYRGY